MNSQLYELISNENKRQEKMYARKPSSFISLTSPRLSDTQKCILTTISKKVYKQFVLLPTAILIEIVIY